MAAADADGTFKDSTSSSSSSSSEEDEPSPAHVAAPAAVRGPPSSLYDASTMWVGSFPIVRRHLNGVPSFYVYCPLHSYGGRRCRKSMQLNQPDEETVITRLHHWIYQGQHLFPHILTLIGVGEGRGYVGGGAGGVGGKRGEGGGVW